MRTAFLAFPAWVELAVESGKVGIVSTDDLGDQKQDRSRAGPTAADPPLAVELATVLCDRGQADELGDCLVGYEPDLRHVGHQTGDGAVGDALYGAEGLVEPVPKLIGGDEPGNLALKLAELAAHQGDDRVDRCGRGRSRFRTALVELHDL